MLLGALRRASAARPLTTASATGFVVMAAGDAASQMLTTGSSEVDVERNLVSATYNGMVSPGFYTWYRVMDWLIPGITPSRLVPKVILSQIVTTGLNNPLYLTWCNHVEALLGATQPVDWSAIRASTIEQMLRELPNLYGTSMLFWLPVTGANYALVPDHLKILWVSTCSVVWGGFVSYVAHRQTVDRAGGHPPTPLDMNHPTVVCTDHDKISS